MIARAQRLPPPIAAIGGFMALLTADVIAGGTGAKVFAIALLAVTLAIFVAWLARSWPALIGLVVLVVLLIPNDGSYTLPKALPFQLEPYRLLVGLVLIGWVVSLLIDPRVRSRASGFEGPVLFIVCVTLASIAANPEHVGTVASDVVKAVWLFLCFILFFYLIVSVVHTREVIERILTLIVTAGALVGLDAIVQRRNGYNFFDHLHTLLPMFTYNPEAAGAIEARGGNLRAFASAGGPIELSAVMAMLVPFAIYLAVSRRQRRWWLATTMLLLGDFAGGSRTGIVGLLVIAGVFLWLRPRQTLRCWPALLPLFVILHFAAPGAIGGLVEEFFPKGGIVQQQSETFIGPGGKVEYGSRLSRIGPEFHEYLKHDPLLGRGYGTRVTGFHETAKDNAIILDNEWLDTILETGILGVFAWLWLFCRAVRRLGARAKLERDSDAGLLGVALASSTLMFAVAMFFFDAFGFVQATFLAFTLLALAAVFLQTPPGEGAGAEDGGSRPQGTQARPRLRLAGAPLAEA